MDRTERAGDLVTVIVPALNEEASIGRCLDSISAQTHAELQVVVVDGGSSDRTNEVVRTRTARDPRIELIQHPGQTIPSCLNRALAAARGCWVVRVDAHSTIPPGYVEHAVELLRPGRWGGVGGRKDAVGHTAAGHAIAAVMASRFGVGNSVYHHGTASRTVDHVAFGSYPIARLRELGGWNERLVANEDFELDHRLRRKGFELLFDPSLRIAWDCRQSICDLFRQYRRYGRGKADVARLHPQSMKPRHILPPVFLLWVAGAIAVAPFRPRVAAAALAPYAVAVAGASWRTARPLDARSRRFVPPAFVAMHIGWGLGFWEGLLGSRVGGITMAA